MVVKQRPSSIDFALANARDEGGKTLRGSGFQWDFGTGFEFDVTIQVSFPPGLNQHGNALNSQAVTKPETRAVVSLQRDDPSAIRLGGFSSTDADFLGAQFVKIVMKFESIGSLVGTAGSWRP